MEGTAGLAAPREIILGSVVSDLSYGSSAKSASVGKIRVLRMGNIQDGKLDWGDLVIRRKSRNIAYVLLTYCLNSPAGRGYCWRVKTDGVSQSNINARKLASFPFLLPSLIEQHEIVR